MLFRFFFISIVFVSLITSCDTLEIEDSIAPILLEKEPKIQNGILHLNSEIINGAWDVVDHGFLFIDPKLTRIKKRSYVTGYYEADYYVFSNGGASRLTSINYSVDIINFELHSVYSVYSYAELSNGRFVFGSGRQYTHNP